MKKFVKKCIILFKILKYVLELIYQTPLLFLFCGVINTNNTLFLSWLNWVKDREVLELRHEELLIAFGRWKEDVFCP